MGSHLQGGGGRLLKPRLFLASLAVLASTLAPEAGFGQAEVAVRDSAGRPIEGARVELWKASEIGAARRTDRGGIARFTAAELSDATSVLVRRLGFAPARASLPLVGSQIEVRLDEIGRSIPAVTILAVARTCPQPDDESARAQWRAAASRYRVPSTEGRFTRLEHASSVVDADAVGIFDGEAPFEGTRAYTTMGMEGAVARVVSRGYVYPLSPIHQVELFGQWGYPPIEAELAGVFAMEEFGAAHTFALVSARSGFVVIRFCARDRRRTGLDGTMRISESDGLLDARWLFWNPDRESESAGGEASFVPAARDQAPLPLMSASGLFWRRMRSGSYTQRWQRYLGWRFHVPR